MRQRCQCAVVDPEQWGTSKYIHVSAAKALTDMMAAPCSRSQKHIPSQGPESEVEPKEGDAAAQHQLATHLERLPHEDDPHVRPVVAVQEGGRTTERGRNPRAECVAARPQQHRVKEGDQHRPEDEHRDRQTTGDLILIRFATECQVGSKVSPRLAWVVVDDFLAEERPEGSRR
eukprot:4634866-Prymnesium_polylepis.4